MFTYGNRYAYLSALFCFLYYQHAIHSRFTAFHSALLCVRARIGHAREAAAYYDRRFRIPRWEREK